MVSPGITAALAALVPERDALQTRLAQVSAAIEALEQLQGGDVPASAARQRRPPAPRPTSVKPEAVAARPAKGTCERAGCGKTFSQPKVGRARHYCSVACGKLARKAGNAVRPVPAVPAQPKRMPRADRPVDNDELDALLARSKRDAA